jgi:uncharacterized protein (DUF488 family)
LATKFEGVATPRIYTIGYGNRRFEDFVELLKRFGVELVVDVRAFPTSKWPEFMKENLEVALPSRGIDYVHIEELGGYRRGGYEAHMRSEEFKRGLKRLGELARKKVAALMCVEANPSGCHRRFIAKRLRRQGWEVVHIVGKGRKQTL